MYISGGGLKLCAKFRGVYQEKFQGEGGEARGTGLPRNALIKSQRFFLKQ